jgi:hypothetical protein
MEELGPSLELSRRQQAHFDAHRDLLPQVFPSLRRFQANLFLWGANILTENYAYIHIFKNGGTAIAAQTKRDHVPTESKEVQTRKWMTLVRDPLEHFLSGWAECGNEYRKLRLERQKKNRDTPFDPKSNESIPRDIQASYDARIRSWIIRVRHYARPKHDWFCEIHSFPQINSILNANGHVPENMEIVGDLKELPAVLNLTGFGHYNTSRATVERNASANAYLRIYFPRRLDLLSNETIRSLCDFLAIDYYMLDYPLPPQCHDMGPTGYTNWTAPPQQTTPRANSDDNAEKISLSLFARVQKAFGKIGS